MFAGVPDLRVEVVADATDGSTVWSEWRWQGTHTDGSPFSAAGVIVAGLRDDGLVQWNRLYIEPVEQVGQGIEDVVGTLSKTPAR